MASRSTDRLPWIIAFTALMSMMHIAALSMIGVFASRQFSQPGLQAVGAELLCRNEILSVTGDPFGRQTFIKSINLETGREQLTDFPVPLPCQGWVTDGNRYWIFGSGLVVEFDGTNRTEYRPQRMPIQPASNSFMYEGLPAIIDNDGVYRLLVFANGEWEERGEVALPGPGRRWTKSESDGEETLVPLSQEPRSSSATANDYLWITCVGTTVDLFHREHQTGVVSYRSGFEFVTRDPETASAITPSNVRSDVSGWKKLEMPMGLFACCRSRDGLVAATQTPGKPIQFWEQTPPGSEKPFRVTKELATGRWETLSLVSANDGRDVYFLRDREFLGPRILNYQHGELKEIPLHLDTPVAQWFRQAKGVLLQIAVVLAIGMMLVVGGGMAISRSQNDSYQFGHDTVRLAPLGRRCLARGIDVVFVLSPLTIFTLIFWPQVHEEQIFRFSWGSGETEQAFAELFHALRPAGLTSLFLFVALIFTQSCWGLTPGKWLCGVRTLRTTLRTCGFTRSLLRELMLAIDAPLFLTPLPGVTSILATECRQRLGDLAADTIVIDVRGHSVTDKVTEESSNNDEGAESRKRSV